MTKDTPLRNLLCLGSPCIFVVFMLIIWQFVTSHESPSSHNARQALRDTTNAAVPSFAVVNSGTTADGFTVLQWNILARPFTKYNDQARRPVKPNVEDPMYQGHGNGLSEGGLETLEQTSKRYALASRTLKAQAPDAVLLQECDPAFFDPAINHAAADIQQMFSVHSSFGSDREASPGTAVLLKKPEAGGQLLKDPQFSTKVIGGDKSTGGSSKSATMVPVILDGGNASDPIWLVSIHVAPLRNAEAAAKRHITMVENELSELSRFVLAGDFNANPSEIASTGTLLSKLRRVAVSPEVEASGSVTSWHSEQGQQPLIDHCFISSDLGILRQATVEKVPHSPYGSDGSVKGASDHIWLSVRLSVKPLTTTDDMKRACSDDSDCVISCNRDLPHCCGELCQCTQAWSKQYNSQLTAHKATENCMRPENGCPVARCAESEHLYSVQCQEGHCVALKTANPNHRERRYEAPEEVVQCADDSYRCADGQVVKRTTPAQGCAFAKCP